MNAPARRGRQVDGASVPNNLPRYLTSFVGRDTELSKLKSLLGQSCMVTLTGASGSGKTRLAAEVGRACLDLWPEGVWSVQLAAINDPRQYLKSTTCFSAMVRTSRAL